GLPLLRVRSVGARAAAALEAAAVDLRSAPAGARRRRRPGVAVPRSARAQARFLQRAVHDRRLQEVPRTAALDRARRPRRLPADQEGGARDPQLVARSGVRFARARSGWPAPRPRGGCRTRTLARDEALELR